LAFSAYKKNVTLTILGEHMGLYLLYLYLAVFSFLYLKKLKISKIYVGFGKF